jgi:hypothetical protein
VTKDKDDSGNSNGGSQHGEGLREAILLGRVVAGTFLDEGSHNRGNQGAYWYKQKGDSLMRMTGKNKAEKEE